MAGVKGMIIGPKIKFSEIEGKYAWFLVYRWEIHKYCNTVGGVGVGAFKPKRGKNVCS